MMRFVAPTALLAASLAAQGPAPVQDHLLCVGFAGEQGPSGNPPVSYPVARYKDNNLDGVIDPITELHAFLKKEFTTNGANGAFMTEFRYVVEDGELAFYFTDSGDGIVMRGQDLNHNGLLEDTEVTRFKLFGPGSGTGSLFAPEGLAVHRDTANNRTIVYVGLDSGSAVRGIWRLVDQNGDGDAEDTGEAAKFVDGTKGLTVPGKTGPVTIQSDWWQKLLTTPTGRLIAYNNGPTSLSTARNPDMFCWYLFTDTNGTASAEVWFNPSTLNGIATHPDFTVGGRFPNWDIVLPTATPPRHPAWNDVSRVALDRRGLFPGFDVYYVMAGYRNGAGFGDANLDTPSVPVSGLIYRIVDRNFNERIDQGELDLHANISNRAVAGVAPFTYVDRNTTNTVLVLSDVIADIAAANGELYLTWLGKPRNVCTIAMKDANANGTIETGEAFQFYVTPGAGGSYPPPFQALNGPYINAGGAGPIARGLLPGPFPAGLAPEGTGCAGSNGLRILVETFGGEAKVGSASLQLGMVRGAANAPAAMWIGATRRNDDLTAIGMPRCTLYTEIAVLQNTTTDADGLARFPLPIPNNPSLAGVTFYSQWAVVDAALTGRLPVVTSNVLKVAIQP